MDLKLITYSQSQKQKNPCLSFCSVDVNCENGVFQVVCLLLFSVSDTLGGFPLSNFPIFYVRYIRQLIMILMA